MLGFVFLFIAILFVCFTIKLYIAAEDEDDYIAKGWEFIIAILFFVVASYFTHKSFEHGFKVKIPTYQEEYEEDYRYRPDQYIY